MRNILRASFCLSIVAGGGLFAAQPHDRITQSINDFDRITLTGHVHPIAATQASAPVQGLWMEHMVMLLNGDEAQEQALNLLLEQQQDPKSANYHQWLTPAQFGQQFGASANDIAKISSWLRFEGFNVDEVPDGRRSIVFSGTSDQVEAAFGTAIGSFEIDGEPHYANLSNPQIPAAFARVVSGIARLHNFQHKHASNPAQAVSPGYTSSSSTHYLSPADYATIYDINSLYQSGVNGTGVSIAVIARSDISMTDVQTFRQNFGLSPNNPQFVLASGDPGTVSGDSTETTLDTEWSGAVAPAATIKVVIGQSTNSADGIDLAAQYAVNHNVAPIITVSYGSCEAAMGSGGLQFYNNLWQQAASQGISVFVSSGDSGASGCDGGSSNTGSGLAINGLCSSIYSTCVGGAEFNDAANPGQYWLPGNNAQYGSATGYIPEVVWNESASNGGSGLWSGGGGKSILWKKPSWQVGLGASSDQMRDVPDIAMAAAGHDGYLIEQNGGLWSVGGTSAAAPSAAGVMALINQRCNASQGNANPNFYAVAAATQNGATPAFHDIVSGNNSVPGVTGFTAAPGYDLASGLGTIDAAQLVAQWQKKQSAPTMSVAASPNAITVSAGQSSRNTVTLNITANNATVPVSLSVTTPNPAVTAVLTSNRIAAPGTGSTSLTISTTATLAAGSYPVTVTALSGSASASATIQVTAAAPTFALNWSGSQSISTIANTSVSNQISVVAQNGFSAAVNFSVSGLPAGVTAKFQPSTVTGSGSTTLSLQIASTAKLGTFPLTVTASGGGVTQTVPVQLVVTALGSCKLTATPTAVSLTAGTPASSLITCGSVSGTFPGPLAFAISGQPAGLSATFASGTAAAGTANTLTLNADPSKVKAGTYTLTASVSAGAFSTSVSLPVVVSVPQTGNGNTDFSIAPAFAAISVKPGSTAALAFNATPLTASMPTLSAGVSGAPMGLTASVTQSMAASGKVLTLSVTAAATLAPGSYNLTLAVTDTKGQQSSIPVNIAVSQTASFGVELSATTITAAPGGAAALLDITILNNPAAPINGATFTFAGVPAGLSISIQKTSITNGNPDITFALKAASSTYAGTYPVKVTVASNGVSYSTTMTLIVGATGQTAHGQSVQRPTLQEWKIFHHFAGSVDNAR